MKFLTSMIAILGLSSASMASKPLFLSIDAVGLWAHPGMTQDVNLINTLGNTYISTSTWQHSGSVMLGLGAPTYQHSFFTVNTSLRFLPIFNIPSQGDVLQLRAPQFRNLSYDYDVNSQILIMDNVVTWTTHALQPGLIAGVGVAANTAGNYHEIPLSSHASPSRHPFVNQTQAQFTYELGAVLDYTLNGIVLECAYRYIDAGQAILGLSPTQNTQEHLSTGPLRYHALSFGVRFDHAH